MLSAVKVMPSNCTISSQGEKAVLTAWFGRHEALNNSR